MRWRLWLIAQATVLCAAVATDVAAESTASQVRLLGIRPDASRGRFALVLEASAPVAYVTRQPDPLTVLVELRNVALELAVGKLHGITLCYDAAEGVDAGLALHDMYTVRLYQQTDLAVYGSGTGALDDYLVFAA